MKLQGLRESSRSFANLISTSDSVSESVCTLSFKFESFEGEKSLENCIYKLVCMSTTLSMLLSILWRYSDFSSWARSTSFRVSAI